LPSKYTNIQPNSLQPAIGYTFIELDSIDSTNTHAMQQIQAKLAEHGTAYFAHQQTAGKGRQGKVWQTEPKANIILSVVLDAARLKISQQFFISAVAALAVVDLLKSYTPNNPSIKWPNDVYYNDSKAAGILIENSLQGNKWQWCVLGIGVNINQTQFANGLINPISLQQITYKQYQAVDLAKQLCAFLEKWYQQLLNGNFLYILDTYNSHLYKKGQVVRLKKNNIAFNCTIDHVNNQGKLLVKDGLQSEFDFGEVEWVIEQRQ
jgi:BirA family transcriptional regulator, biotin operon repressor / biotin---[acetyl-CoA-carboxylase] ligase